MKYSLLFLLLLCNLCSFAQEETKTHHVETDYFEEEKFVSPYDLVFQTFEETESLFKISGANVLFARESLDYYSHLDNFLSIAEVAYERKIGPSFSINNEFSFANFRYHLGGAISVEPRWYYNMKRKIASKESANNLSGNYIGLGFEYGQFFHENGGSNKVRKLGLKYGLQRRIFGRGFIDIRIGPEYYLEKNKIGTDSNGPASKSKAIGFSSQIKLGFILGKSNLSLKAAQKCDVFQCFEERKHLFKIDFLNLLNITSLDDYRSISGSFAFSFEQKIGTAFSLNNELVLAYRYLHAEYLNLLVSQFNDFSFGLHLKSEFRYYYNLKKKIAQGKSGNNLSGGYLGLRLRTGDLLGHTSNKDLVKPSFRTRENLTFSMITGVQKTVFKRVYFDYTFGIDLLKYNTKKGQIVEPIYDASAPQGNRLYLGLISNLRIGIHF